MKFYSSAASNASMFLIN